MRAYSIASPPTIRKNFRVGSILSEASEVLNTPVPPAIANMGFAIDMIMSAKVLAHLPNQKFVTAIDVSSIEEYIMTVDRRRQPEPEELLEDQEALMALSSKVIFDLLENEPDTYTIDDVKVRFK